MHSMCSMFSAAAAALVSQAGSLIHADVAASADDAVVSALQLNSTIIATPVTLAEQRFNSSAMFTHRMDLRAFGPMLDFDLDNGSQVLHALQAQFEYELAETSHSSQVRNKIGLAVIEVIGLGWCGVDRCFMGQPITGLFKGLTFGGFLVWGLVDYIVIACNMLLKKDEINDVGYNSEFQDGTVNPAFWVFLTVFTIKFLLALRRHWMRSRQSRDGGECEGANSDKDRQKVEGDS